MWFAHFFFYKLDMWPSQAENILTKFPSTFLWLWDLCSTFFFCILNSSVLAVCGAVKNSPCVTHYMGKLTNVKAQKEPVCLILLLDRKKTLPYLRISHFCVFFFHASRPSLFSFLLMIASICVTNGMLGFSFGKWLSEQTVPLYVALVHLLAC